VGLLPTASGDRAEWVERFYTQCRELRCPASHLPLFGRTPDPAAWIAEQDVILVGGGNTRSMLALWREWGIDTALRDAWESGTVLAGWSAGAICWFEQGVTDSHADQLSALAGLGFLPGSLCPHYDGEPTRRPEFARMLAEGEIGPGLAVDDGAAVHYQDRLAARLVRIRPEAGAYEVSATDGGVREEPLTVETIDVGSD
jgi:peptidase E